MSTLPRIDSPCPLSADEQRAIDGHCDRCDRTVHRLDALDTSARRALFADSDGPICVSYRVPAPRRVGRVGALIAATLITTGAFAAEAPADVAAPPTGSRIAREAPRDLDPVLVGAVNDPQDAKAAPDTSRPALPVRNTDAPTGSRIAREAPRDLDPVLVGAVNDPQDAREPVDTSTPVLPQRDAQAQEPVLLVGGVADPKNAQWVDIEDAAPVLPMHVSSDGGTHGP